MAFKGRAGRGCVPASQANRLYHRPLRAPVADTLIDQLVPKALGTADQGGTDATVKKKRDERTP